MKSIIKYVKHIIKPRVSIFFDTPQKTFNAPRYNRYHSDISVHANEEFMLSYGIWRICSELTMHVPDLFCPCCLHE